MKMFLISTFVILLVAISAAVAAGVDVSLSTNSLVGYSGETQSVDVVMKNTQSSKDTFTLSIFPAQFEKVTSSMESFLLTLSPNEEKVVKLYLTIAIDADLVSPVFTVTAKSTSDESVSDSENLILIIQRQTPVYIPSLSLEKYTLNPGEGAKIAAKVFNLDETRSGKYFLKITVRKGTNIVKTFEETLDSISPKSAVDVSKTFTLDNYIAPGSYAVEAELRDASGQLKYSKSVTLNINTVTQPPTEYTKRSGSYSILFSSVSIKVKNEGNVDLPSFVVTQSLPGFAQSLFDPEIEPVATDSSGSRVVYSWSVPALSPGGEYAIKYNIAIWRMWLTVGIIAGVGYGAYRWLSKPRIGKAVRHEGDILRGKEIIVLLEVKNRALHEIKDVEIIDVVPQIARVVDRFDTLRPKAKRVTGGIELRWSFGSMRPGEERVVTYRIRPVVDIIGHLNLPEAQMIFFDSHKMKRMSASKETLVKAGES